MNTGQFEFVLRLLALRGTALPLHFTEESAKGLCPREIIPEPTGDEYVPPLMWLIAGRKKLLVYGYRGVGPDISLRMREIAFSLER